MRDRLITIVAVSLVSFHIYTAIFGIMQSYAQRSFHLTLAMILVVLVYGWKGEKRGGDNRIGIIDWMFMSLILFSFGYIFINATEINERFSYVTPLTQIEWIASIVGLLSLIVCVRRCTGWPLAIIASVFVLYGMFGQFLPGILKHRGVPPEMLLDQLFLSSGGIWGVPLGVSATFIAIYIIFGAFLERTGGGSFFIDLSVAAMGRFRGGPAKVAVVASGLMGMISGTAVANVATTGVISIPLMKRTGYSPVFAGAVESVASTGGQIMPPIMGASAFIMAEMIGIPYSSLILAAAIPAFLYYICVFFQVDFRAANMGLKGIPKSERPSVGSVISGLRFLYLVPIIVLVYLLMAGRTPMYSGIVSIGIMLAVVVIITLVGEGSKSEGIQTLGRNILSAMRSGGTGLLDVACACAAAGIIIGVFNITGFGMRLNSTIIEIAGGSLLLLLILTMITSIILGMGLPTVAAYLVQVSLTVPALITVGVHPVAAHLFIFYFAILSAITPPVALAAFAAAGISGANAMATGFTAMRLGIVAMIVPYFFVYGPPLLLMGTTAEIIRSTVTSVIGAFMLAGGLEGWVLNRARWFERVLLVLGGLGMIETGLLTDSIGIGILVLVLFTNKMSGKTTDVKSQEVKI